MSLPTESGTLLHTITPVMSALMFNLTCMSCTCIGFFEMPTTSKHSAPDWTLFTLLCKRVFCFSR